MKPLVKICGITSRKDALLCAGAGADFLGFIFYRNSPRYIEPELAREIIADIPGYVTPVGVFVNESREIIIETVAQTGIRLIQLSGDEGPAECEGFGQKVWKAFRFRNSEEIQVMAGYRDLAAAMIDGARAPLYGGSGEQADFSIASEMKKYFPLILAGGLDPDNIAESIRSVMPHGVDVNSGVESEPGKKDRAKVEKLFERIAKLDNA